MAHGRVKHRLLNPILRHLLLLPIPLPSFSASSQTSYHVHYLLPSYPHPFLQHPAPVILSLFCLTLSWLLNCQSDKVPDNVRYFGVWRSFVPRFLSDMSEFPTERLRLLNCIVSYAGVASQ